MKRTLVVFTGLVLLVFCWTNFAAAQTIEAGSEQSLRVLVLEGKPYERGYQHGKILREDIHALVQLWKADIERTYKTDADTFIKKFLRETDFPKAIRKWTPGLWQEVEGISDGSGIDLETMFAFQLVDEIWVLGQDIRGEKCTTIGVERTEKFPAMVAQNLDIPTFYHGFQTLLRIKEPERDLETLLFTFPGFIAANGINNHAVAVVVNAVQQLANSRDGLPVAFVIRGILLQKTYDDAVKFINTVQHGAPQNYLIGGREKVGSFECATTHIIPFVPFADARFTYHTNHPLKNKNFSPGFLQSLESRKTSPKDFEFQCPRFRALQQLFPDNAARMDLDVLKDVFSNRETIINNRGTFGCTIFVLGDSPELHISPGRPDTEPFQIFQFDKKCPR
jgi:isopenicillin-N N-acyltransferase-like protein